MSSDGLSRFFYSFTRLIDGPAAERTLQFEPVEVGPFEQEMVFIGAKVLRHGVLVRDLDIREKIPVPANCPLTLEIKMELDAKNVEED